MTNRFTDHLLTGDHPSRPSASAVPTGTLYSCTTHSLIYKTDGTAWSTWATLGGGGGGGGITGQSVARGVLARSYAWATDVQSWTGSGLSWSSAGWIQLSAGINGFAYEPGTPSDGVVDYKWLWRPHMSGQGSQAPIAFDFHLTSYAGDYSGWRILLDFPNTNVVLQRRYQDLGVISTQAVETVKMKWANDAVMDWLVRYQTLNGVDVIKVFVDGTLLFTHESSEFASGLLRFFLNNSVCRIGSFAAYT